MSLFDSWFQQPGIQGLANQAQTTGYKDPNQNIVSSLAALAKAMQPTPMQHMPMLPMQPGQMLPPVTFQSQAGAYHMPFAPMGQVPGGQVDFARGPSLGGQGGY